MKHRRARPSGHTTAAVTVLVAAAVALLTVGPFRLGEQADGAPAGGIPAVVAGTAGPGTPAPPQASSPSDSQPVEEGEPAIPQSEPRLVEAPSIGLRAVISPYTPAQVAANDGTVNPSSLWTVAWWTGGGKPGTDADNTVYLYGHTWKEPAVFNHLKNLEPQDDVFVTTRTGRLRYVVDGSFTVLKKDLDDHPEVVAAEPGRLLLIGCYRKTGREDSTTRNVVVTAHLA